uniref:Uncharacterized protein n=1 Tax=Rhizophora mucronata TaxID=61149 RepID=A0A2P2R457_RHIMU
MRASCTEGLFISSCMPSSAGY